MLLTNSLTNYRQCPYTEKGLCNGTVSVRLSVRRSFCLFQHEPTATNLQVFSCGPSRQEISIDCCTVGAQLQAAACGDRMRAVPRCQRTQEAEHRLVLVRPQVELNENSLVKTVV